MTAVAGTSAPDDINAGYFTIPISFHADATCVRHIYLRPHAGSDTLPTDRTLFITGLPAKLSHELLAQLFSRFGDLERAAVHSSGLSAVILFAATKGLDKAMRAATKGRVIVLEPPEHTSAYGVKAWVEAHKLLKPGNVELQRQLDEWTAAYEAAEEARKLEAMANMEDEGWTVVQRHKVIRAIWCCCMNQRTGIRLCTPLF
jgi:RNA recognition motif. (a.k.a. RRM, RBD, or RNP domain)